MNQNSLRESFMNSMEKKVIWYYLDEPQNEGYKKDLVRRFDLTKAGQEKLKRKTQKGLRQYVLKALKYKHNNLVSWQSKDMVEKKLSDPAADRRGLDQLLRPLLSREGDPEALWEGLCTWFGFARFDVMAFLFFLRDPERYMPLMSRDMDRGLDRLGMPHDNLQKHVTWARYQHYLEELRKVQDLLNRRYRDILSQPITLMDAHSFVWLANEPRFAPKAPVPEAPAER